ncbi:YopX family protein [Capnocytophaga canis]|uniref:YopX family protein n=1 Tax=Capnocytophaga canis TaxID=1848903 RepID=UPI0015621670|nr:YopX family protein [Capnocytophaga canis]
MKREIKFRAFYPEVKTFYKIAGWDFESEEVRIVNDTYDFWVDTDDVILMQFTGLYDKNGKEIYEGDVIPIFGKNHAVKFNYGMFTINDREMRRYIHSIPLEVIGNVYENPELVK